MLQDIDLKTDERIAIIELPSSQGDGKNSLNDRGAHESKKGERHDDDHDSSDWGGNDSDDGVSEAELWTKIDQTLEAIRMTIAREIQMVGDEEV